MQIYKALDRGAKNRFLTEFLAAGPGGGRRGGHDGRSGGGGSMDKSPATGGLPRRKPPGGKNARSFKFAQQFKRTLTFSEETSQASVADFLTRWLAGLKSQQGGGAMDVRALP